MKPYQPNHDGAALGPSVQYNDQDQRSTYPYTVQGGATIRDTAGEARRRDMLHTTYLYLAVAVAGAMGGAWLGAHNETFLKLAFNSGIFFWIGIMIVINMLPRIAINIAQTKPRMAVPALAVNGFVSGLALAPLVFLGLMLSKQNVDGGNIVSTACVVTGAIFAAITAYVHMNKTKFETGNALAAGLFGFAVIAVPANMFLHSTMLGLLISGAIGMIGAYQLAKTTSMMVNDPNYNQPAAGALMLFAGVFNLFQAILSLLLSGGRD